MPRTTKPSNSSKVEVIEHEETVSEAVDAEPEAPSSLIPELSNTAMVAIVGFGIALLIIIVQLASGDDGTEVAALTPAQAESIPARPPTPGFSSDGIERKGEGRHFYTTIKIPPGAETLYLSGSGAAQQADGSWGDMEQQTIDTFSKFKQTLEEEGWSMSDIVQVRAFAKAGEYGLLDFDGFNRGYREFFGTVDNPMKPVRSFVQIADLVVEGWLVEIEIRAARVPN